MRQILEKYLDKITEAEAEDLRKGLKKILETLSSHFDLILEIKTDSLVKRALMSGAELRAYRDALQLLEYIAEVPYEDARIELGELLLNEYKLGMTQFVIKGILV